MHLIPGLFALFVFRMNATLAGEFLQDYNDGIRGKA